MLFRDFVLDVMPNVKALLGLFVGGLLGFVLSLPLVSGLDTGLIAVRDLAVVLSTIFGSVAGFLFMPRVISLVLLGLFLGGLLGFGLSYAVFASAGGPALLGALPYVLVATIFGAVAGALILPLAVISNLSKKDDAASREP